jgi:hypothetical protein
MRYLKRLTVATVAILGGILGFLLLGLGYSLFIGKPITLNRYYSQHNISNMAIYLDSSNGPTGKVKELTVEQINSFLQEFGSYKVYKSFFRKSLNAKHDNYYINIRLRDSIKNPDFDVFFPLTDQGELKLIRYTFYPYHTKHKDMYSYLFDLLE